MARRRFVMIGQLPAQDAVILPEPGGNLFVIEKGGLDAVVPEQVAGLLHLEDGGALFGALSFQPAPRP